MKADSLTQIVKETAAEIFDSLEGGDIEPLIYSIYGHFATLTYDDTDVLAEMKRDAILVVDFIDERRRFLSRWHSLKPAVDQMLRFWEPLRLYFHQFFTIHAVNESNERAKSMLLDEANRTKMSLLYLSHILSFIEEAVKNLDKPSACVIDGHQIMKGLKDQLDNHISTSFYGTMIVDELTALNKKSDEKEYLDAFDQATNGAICRLTSLYDYKPDSLRARMALLDLAVGPLNKPKLPSISVFRGLAKELKIGIDQDRLLMDWEELRDWFVAGRGFWQRPVVERWRDVFMNVEMDRYEHLYKLISYILSLPVSLSHPTGILWTKDTNIGLGERASWDLVRNETLIAENMDRNLKPFEYFVKIKDDDQVLDEIQVIWDKHMKIKGENVKAEYIDDDMDVEPSN